MTTPAQQLSRLSVRRDQVLELRLKQPPLTPRSVVAKLDGLKKTYEVPNFRIGGKYDLAKPESWRNGGEGGATLESLGAKPARTSYIALGTPKRNAKSRRPAVQRR